MSSPDLRRAIITLGNAAVAIDYTADLVEWFGEFPSALASAQPVVTIRIQQDPSTDSYRVSDGLAAESSRLTLGDAIAAVWEHVCYHIIDAVQDAVALHGAALSCPEGLVVLSGASGSGKTSLALWYQAQGFDLGTDEVVTLRPSQAAEALHAAALRRPVIVKRPEDLFAIPRLQADRPWRTENSAAGTIVRQPAPNTWTTHTAPRALVLFPSFRSGAALSLQPLSAARLGLALMANCVNTRNLPGGGLPSIKAIVAQARGVSLEYGATEQLTETIDVFSRQVLAGWPDRHDLQALCDAFTARARHSTQASPSDSGDKTATPRLESSHARPPETAARFPRRLTVGMATYDDYDGVYFTIQSIRLQNPALRDQIEFLVIDNNPDGPCAKALHELETLVNGYRYVPRGDWQGTAIRDAIFAEASNDLVLCLDSHVMLEPGALVQLLAHMEAAGPGSRDLWQGPLVHDGLEQVMTHFAPQWNQGMYGTWAQDARGFDPDAAAFDIPMQGLGLFACRREAWPGFNPAFRGFGGEEGYIHEKIRQAGGRTLCLPALRWIHRFARPLGTRYTNRWEDRMRNYFIGFTELGLDTTELEAHFATLLGTENAKREFRKVRQEIERNPALVATRSCRSAVAAVA